MTPNAFKKWTKTAPAGRQVIYHQGTHLTETRDSTEMGEVAWQAYENGLVSLFQKRLTPAVVTTKSTRGTFAWIAVVK